MVKNQKEMWNKNVKRQIKFSSFITFSKDGEINFYICPKCPRCRGTMSGELAGIFECELCGFSEVESYSSTHGNWLSLEIAWKILRLFCFRNRCLEYLVSIKLHEFFWSLHFMTMRARRYI